ncbi:MAG: chorismate synthase [Flavobacteriales bacterium]
MPGNTFGQLFRLTTFGESHGAALGGIIDGCPAGLELDLAVVQQELDRRRPGSTSLGTARTEGDRVEFLSGIIDARLVSEHPEWVQEGTMVTLGTPIGFILRNQDARSGDYDALKNIYRPGHADLTWDLKYGVRDHRGGGRSSARETACRVVGGAIARQLLAREGTEVQAYVSQVGGEVLAVPPSELRFDDLWSDPVRCPDATTSARMAALIEQVRSEGDSVGGVVSCSVRRVPQGLGEPVFSKLDADLAAAMLGINAAKGFEIGSGFRAAAMRGSEHNGDLQMGGRIEEEDKATGSRVETPMAVSSNTHSGGTLGGISSGENIHFAVAFKPPATIARPQRTVDARMQEVTLEAKGRHDPCVVPRAVPIVEAMTCLVLADHLLRQRTARL